MKEESRKDPILEPERYELDERQPYRLGWARREFLQLSGAGLFILLTTDPAPAAQESGRRRGSGQSLPEEISAWLHVAEDGRVTAFTGKVEVGQNARTSLTQVVAEELHCPLDSIQLVMGDTALTPYDRGTFGSLTTPTMVPQLRRMAAAARETLLDLAAREWGVAREAISVQAGQITHSASQRSAGLGELSRGRKLARRVSADPAMTPPEKWQMTGRSIPKVDGKSFVTGRHRYTSDLKLPGMLYGKMVRPSGFGGVPRSLDASAARQLAGVVVVRDGNFVGVAAPSEHEAARAVAAIRGDWEIPSQVSSQELYRHLKSHPTEARGWRGRSGHSTGSVEEAQANADLKLASTYHIAYIAHAPLEPRAAVAQWTGPKLTVWTGTQRPFGVRSELAETFHLAEEDVRVIVPDTGSGYGGKHTGEAAIEAARLAKAAGKPVKLVWTREEEFTWAYFRPAGVIEVESGVRQGILTSWEFHNYNSGASGIRTPYAVENQKIEFHPTESPLRQGSYRALAATANHFAREVHMDELASLLGEDPLEFRLRHLNDPRLAAVLRAAAQAFGWSKRGSRKGAGSGIACGFEKGGYIGTCAEVRIEPSERQVKITSVVAAFECGAILNPDHLKNQIEGAIVQGIGGALFEAIEFENGRILNPRFSRYRVPRFSDTPRIEVVLLDRKDLPSTGAGETPIVGLAPAVANAIFDAVGIRLRSLPLAPQGLPDSKRA